MANTYTQLFIHIVFAVKGRENLIPTSDKENLFKYIGGIIKNKGHKLYIINGMSDHVHILVGLNPNEAISTLVKEIKRCSSIYINEKKNNRGKFEWQAGYGAFSYAKSNLNRVFKYIENQEEHHKKRSFLSEYKQLLEKFEVEYNNDYLFNDI